MYNPFTLSEKTILITGASSGIGRTTAIECSKLGAKCIITGRNSERLSETYTSLVGNEHHQIVTDLTDEDSLKSLVDEVPMLDGVVNNAGVAQTKLISFIKQKDFDVVFPTNIYAPAILTKMLLKSKKINNDASIVFTSSIASMSSDIGNAIYGMSKSAIETFARYCAIEFAGKRMRFNSVHPGVVETNMIHGGIISEEDLQADMQRYPLGRYGKPEDVAWAIIYLLSDASSWITGTQLVIDGGIHLK